MPLAQARESDFKHLVGHGYMSGHAIQDKMRERIELERDLATQRARLIEARSALSGNRYQQLSAEHSKATQRKPLTT